MQADLETARQMLAEAEGDADTIAMAEEEIQEITATLPEAEHALQMLLLPKDKDDSRNAILEVRAGTGGDEAALFAADLFGMYQRFATRHGWRFEVMEVSDTGIGGYKEAAATISGADVFARLLNPVSTASSVSRKLKPAAAFTPRRRPWPCCRKSKMSISRSTKAICGLMSSGPLAPVASR